MKIINPGESSHPYHTKWKGPKRAMSNSYFFLIERKKTHISEASNALNLHLQVCLHSLLTTLVFHSRFYLCFSLPFLSIYLY